MPLPPKPLSVPPLTVMSAAVKSVDGSDSVKLSVAVSPSLRAVLSVATATVGRSVSTASVAVLSASRPSALKTPAAPRKALLPTCTVAVAWLPAVGVKTAL